MVFAPKESAEVIGWGSRQISHIQNIGTSTTTLNEGENNDDVDPQHELSSLGFEDNRNRRETLSSSSSSSKRKQRNNQSFANDDDDALLLSQSTTRHKKAKDEEEYYDVKEEVNTTLSSTYYGPIMQHSISSNSFSNNVEVEFINNIDGYLQHSIISFDRITTTNIHNNPIFIRGRAKISSIQGSVDVFGFTLTSSSQKTVIVDCPDWMSSISIRPLTKDNQENFTVKVKVTSMDKDEVTYQLLSEKQVPSPIIIDNKWNDTTENILQNISINTNNIMTSKNHNDNDNYQKESNRILVCGAKNVGKSTFAKYLCNRMLSNSFEQIAFLDCDVGQPEFSPPGLLSLSILSNPLLCPPYVHMICNSRFDTEESDQGYAAADEHYSAMYYSSTTSKMNPNLYIDALKVLIDEYENLCKKTSSNIPLIVNTDGWVKGMGFEILSSVIDVVNPAHIVQIVGTTKAKFFDLSLHATTSRHIHVLLSQKEFNQENFTTSNSINRSESSASILTVDQEKRIENNTIAPSTLRNFRFIVYFVGGYKSFLKIGATLSSSGVVDDDCRIGSTLARMNPYAVPFDSVTCMLIDEDGHRSTCLTTEGNDIDLVYDIFNGSIVGLCKTPGSNGLPHCIGLGIVRSIDRKRRLFYILTPLPPSKLQNNVTTIIRGQSQLPFECVFLGDNSESFPYQSCDGISFGSGEVLKLSCIQQQNQQNG